jgi:hypothetical protein
MTPEEIVKSLGEWGAGLSDVDAAIDLIERQAKVIDAVESIIEKIRRETGPDTDARDALDDCVDAIRKLPKSEGIE